MIFGFERGFFRIFSPCASKKAAGQGLNGSGLPVKASPRNFPKRNFSDSFFCPMPLVLSSLRPRLDAGKKGRATPVFRRFFGVKRRRHSGRMPRNAAELFLLFSFNIRLWTAMGQFLSFTGKYVQSAQLQSQFFYITWRYCIPFSAISASIRSAAAAAPPEVRKLSPIFSAFFR